MENLREKVFEKLEELSWDDSDIEEIMQGFFYSPYEAIEMIINQKGKDPSDSHIKNLASILEIEEEEE